MQWTENREVSTGKTAGMHDLWQTPRAPPTQGEGHHLSWYGSGIAEAISGTWAFGFHLSAGPKVICTGLYVKQNRRTPGCHADLDGASV